MIFRIGVIRIFSAGLILGIAPASAHLEPGTLLPKGGETFRRGQVMAISWTVEQEHSGTYQIAYSPRPLEWVTILDGVQNNTGIRFGAKMNASWTVPDTLTLTTSARIRVWQRSNEGGNSRAGETSNFYTLVSGGITISGGTAIEFPKRNGDANWDWNGHTLSVRPDGRIFLEKAALPGAGRIRLAR